MCGLIAIGGAWAAAAGGETVVAIAVIAAGRRDPGWARSSARCACSCSPPWRSRCPRGRCRPPGIDLDGGVGDRDYRPASALDLREKYELGMGELIVDLRQTDLPPGDVPLEIDLGVGEARVIVPEDVCVATDAQVGIGEVRNFDQHNEGIDVDFDDLPDARARRPPGCS